MEGNKLEKHIEWIHNKLNWIYTFTVIGNCNTEEKNKILDLFHNLTKPDPIKDLNMKDIKKYDELLDLSEEEFVKKIQPMIEKGLMEERIVNGKRQFRITEKGEQEVLKNVPLESEVE